VALNHAKRRKRNRDTWKIEKGGRRPFKWKPGPEPKRSQKCKIPRRKEGKKLQPRREPECGKKRTAVEIEDRSKAISKGNQDLGNHLGKNHC